MKKQYQKLISGISAVLMMAQCAVLPAFAGEQLGQGDFQNGVGLPWHICESTTGKMDFTIDNGSYNITVVNPGGVSNGGEDRWDCQFRHRNLTLVSGHTYRLTYSVWASNSGWMYAKIGDMTNDDAELWHSNGNRLNMNYLENASMADVETALKSATPTGEWKDYNSWEGVNINGNQWNTFAYEFTLGSNGERATSANGTGEWTFHFGGDGQYTPSVCFPAGTQLKFDNLVLLDMTDNSNDYVPEPVWNRADILTNQIGYFTNGIKEATLLSDSSDSIDFDLKDMSGNSVFSGKSGIFGKDEDSGDSVHIIDFSDFHTDGTYYLETKDGKKSREFKIGITDEYSGMLYDSLNYFYQNRSGIPIESQYITSGDAQKLARSAGHPSDIANIQQTWGYTGSSGTQDVTGGWYDAGDHGKYVVNGGISLWMLQNLYERASLHGTENAYRDGAMKLPENANDRADLLDEARYEMEWMLKMIVKDGSCQNMAYHKVHDIKWTALAVAPADDPEERILKPPTTTATLNLAACGAQAYRLWKDIDPTFAEQCLNAARNAYDAAKNHPDMYAPLDESVGGGAYGDDDATDEFYWAACELYTSIGEDRYYKDMQASPHFLEVPTALNGGESVGVVGSFDWGHTSALGSLTMILNKDKLTEQEVSTLEDNINEAGRYFVNLENTQGYRLPYGQSTISYDDSDKGYVWGSNSFVADNAIIMAYAYDLNKNTLFLNGVVNAMDYLLGNNPMDYSYVTGYGTHSVQYPHHRWWSNLLSDNFPKAPCGVLVGGPNSGMEDPWVRGSGWKKGQISPQKCYLDHIEAWSVNECTINWNTPLAWVTSYLLEQNGGIISGHASMGTNDGGNGTSNPDSSNSVDNSNTANTPAETSPSPTSAQNNSSVAENAVTPSEVNEVNETSANAGNADSSADERTTPEVPEKTSNNKVPWIVGGCLIGLISLEIFAYKMIKMMKDKK